MSHYECKRCGTYGCFGECEAQEREFTAALERAGMSNTDYHLLVRTRDMLQANYQASSYSIGVVMKEHMDRLTERIREVEK